MKRSPTVLALVALLCIAVVAVAVWGWIARGWVTTDVLEPEAASRAFELERQAHADEEPIVTIEAGTLARRPAPDVPGPAPSELLVLVYHRPSERLIRAEVPFWFLRMKGPASARVLRGAGIDLGELGLTADELARYGPSLVFDGVRGEDRVLLVTR